MTKKKGYDTFVMYHPSPRNFDRLTDCVPYFIDLSSQRRTTRTAIALDTSQALLTIYSVVNSLLPEKREKRRNYFTQIGSQNFLPGKGAHYTKEAIANHVTKTFNTWAERFEMSDGDSAVVLSVLGSLANVTTANRNVLDDVPMRNASKELILSFFGVKDAEEKMEAQAHQNEIDDDLDDSELLECPDPSSLNAVQQIEQSPFPHRYYHSATNQSMVHDHQSFTGHAPFNFTSIVPPQQLEHRPTSCIFPESYSLHGEFSHSLINGNQQKIADIDIHPFRREMHRNHLSDGNVTFGGYYRTQQFYSL